VKIIIDSNYKTLNMYHNNRLREIATTVDFPKDSVEISPKQKSCQRMHIPSGWKRLNRLKKLIESGNYIIDCYNIAEKIINNATPSN
jgi:anti-sigma28 factor (negative regulator of flagellin synthesis)